MEANNQQAAQAAEEVKVDAQFEKIEEQETTEQPSIFEKGWNKTQEFSGSVCATIKEKPGESLAIAGLGYAGIKFIGWVAGKLCGKKD